MQSLGNFKGKVHAFMLLELSRNLSPGGKREDLKNKRRGENERERERERENERERERERERKREREI